MSWIFLKSSAGARNRPNVWKFNVNPAEVEWQGKADVEPGTCV